MNVIQKDAIIIGGGPAGLAAAIKLYESGVHEILIIERERHLGGILRQCIHDGFGLSTFKENLSGPEYAARYIDRVLALGIPFVTDTSVLSLSPDKIVSTASRNGLCKYQAKAVVLAMGCRERTRGAISIPGERPAGVFTAGVAQSYINLHNIMVGKEVVILGSGDIGLIMARRLSLEGAHVQAVFEIMAHPGGLTRNVLQCLEDYNIPLLLSHTVTEIHGNSRLTGVTVSQVDESLRPIDGTQRTYNCDTLILSVGLIPENELSIEAGVLIDNVTGGAVVDESCQTSVPGIFSVGNTLHVHDLVDFVSLEAERMATAAAGYIMRNDLPDCRIAITAGENVGYTVPQKASGKADIALMLRVKKPMQNCTLEVLQQGRKIYEKKLKKALPAEMIGCTIKKGVITSESTVEVRIC